MFVTRSWIKACAGPKGAWNKAQLAVLGIPWPPPKGWIESLLNTEVSESKSAEFERLAGQSIEQKKIDKFYAGGYDYPVYYTWPRAKPHDPKLLNFEGSWEKPKDWPVF